MQYLSQWRLSIIFGVCLVGLWVSLASFFSKDTLDRFPDIFYKQQISLGLDLQGGSSLLLEVDLKDVSKDYMYTLLDEVRRSFRKEHIGHFNLRAENQNSLKFTLRNLSQKDKALSVIRYIIQDVSVKVENAQDVIVHVNDSVFKQREEGAVKQSIEIVRRRIDEMGTKEPSIQQQGKNRILVQLPGVSDPKQIIDILGTTARLTFRLLHPSVYYHDKMSVPYGFEVLSGDAGRGENTVPVKYLAQKKIQVSGEMLVDSQPTLDQNGAIAVSFSLDAPGA